jgi:hypothetical protein
MFLIVTESFKDLYSGEIPEGEIIRTTGEKSYVLLSTNTEIYPPAIRISNYFRAPSSSELEHIRATYPLYRRVGNIRGYGEIGADPEVFVVDSNAKMIPAYKFLPSNTPDTNIYWDGFQAEFRTIPSSCIAYWIDYTQERLQKLYKLVKAYDPTAKLTGECVLPIPPNEFLTAAPEHLQLGCAPSKNAYGDYGVGVESGASLPIRFAGCHIHLGSRRLNRDEESFKNIVKTIDKIAGVLSVVVLQELENPLRRRYYGLAGEYRTPRWGLEYRVLSSACLWHPMLMNLFAGFVRCAMWLALEKVDNEWVASEEEVCQTINELDIDQAQRIIKRNQKMLEEIWWGLYLDPTQAYLAKPLDTELISPKVAIEEFVLKGIKKFIKLDIEKNWYLTKHWCSHAESPKVMVWRCMRDWLGEKD